MFVGGGSLVAGSAESLMAPVAIRPFIQSLRPDAVRILTYVKAVHGDHPAQQHNVRSRRDSMLLRLFGHGTTPQAPDTSQWSLTAMVSEAVSGNGALLVGEG